MLDRLQELGRLRWRWDYEPPRAVFHVRVARGEWEIHDTRSTERLVQRECDALGIRWKPIPHPGGEVQRAAVRAWIESGR